jgi:SOS-response transcriptional repressor LexA
VLEFIEDFIERHRFSPSLADIAQAFGLASRGGAFLHAKNLKAKGWITWHDNKQRTISLTEDT